MIARVHRLFKKRKTVLVGILVIVCAIIGFAYSFWYNSRMKSSGSNTNETTDNYSSPIKGDTFQPTPADLRICAAEPPNIPYSIGVEKADVTDSYRIRVHICNYGESTAFNLSDSLFEIMRIENDSFIVSRPFSGFLPNQNIQYNEGRGLVMEMTSHDPNSHDTAYIFIKIHYSDSTHKSGVLRDMYRIFPFKLNRVLPNPDLNVYNQIKGWLIRNKLW